MAQTDLHPVVWITGLSGAGKTTVAARVADSLSQCGHSVVHLGDDDIRRMFSQDPGHSRRDRLRNAYRLAHVCHFLQDHGLTVVCSSMGLSPETLAWNRRNLEPYVEVFLDVPMQELKRRDQKGEYSAFDRGEGGNVVGLDITYRRPRDSDLVLANATAGQVEVNVARIVSYVEDIEGAYRKTA